MRSSLDLMSYISNLSSILPWASRITLLALVALLSCNNPTPKNAAGEESTIVDTIPVKNIEPHRDSVVTYSFRIVEGEYEVGDSVSVTLYLIEDPKVSKETISYPRTWFIVNDKWSLKMDVSVEWPYTTRTISTVVVYEKK